MDSIQQYLSSDDDRDEKTSTGRRKRSLSSLGINLLQSPDKAEKNEHTFKRNKPHVQGNWAGSLFISFSLDEFSAQTSDELKDFACGKVRLFHEHLVEQAMKRERKKDPNEEIVIVPHLKMNRIDSNFDDDDDGNSSDSDSDEDEDDCNDDSSNAGIHISLVKPFFLQKQSIQPFINDLKQRIGIIHPFSVQFDVNTKNIEILVNDNSTRSFLTLPVYHDKEALRNLVLSIDAVMSKFGLETYYSNPKFHCSIASWKGHHQWINDSMSALNAKTQDNEKKLISFFVRGIHCNFGSTEQHYISFNM